MERHVFAVGVAIALVVGCFLFDVAESYFLAWAFAAGAVAGLWTMLGERRPVVRGAPTVILGGIALALAWRSNPDYVPPLIVALLICIGIGILSAFFGSGLYHLFPRRPRMKP